MVTVEQIRKILLEEYGIQDERQLDKAMKEMGGIKVGAFTGKKEKKEKEQVQNLAS